MGRIFPFLPQEVKVVRMKFPGLGALCTQTILAFNLDSESFSCAGR